MLRSLLADRFKLTLHHDTGELPVLCAANAKRDGTFPDAGYTPFFAAVDFSKMFRT